MDVSACAEEIDLASVAASECEAGNESAPVTEAGLAEFDVVHLSSFLLHFERRSKCA